MPKGLDSAFRKVPLGTYHLWAWPSFLLLTGISIYNIPLQCSPTVKFKFSLTYCILLIST